VACWLSVSLSKCCTRGTRAALTQAQSRLEKSAGEKSQRTFHVQFYFDLFFMLILVLAKPFPFLMCGFKMTGAIIYCTLYCIKYVTDITVHLYINIVFIMLYMCIQQTQTVQCRQTHCIYVCKISSTYQHCLLHAVHHFRPLPMQQMGQQTK
jgi:hypothetical protein